MVDPKMLELFVYNDIPHLLTPVVTDPKKAIYALKWAVREMETRYKAMSGLGVRNIDGFNKKIRDNRLKGEHFLKRVQTGFDQETGKPIFENQSLDYQELPYIVVVVDEMADLMLVAGKEIELAVQRLAQMARAAGIHLIMATQRPSVDVITGTIKANFPTRISFQVTSKIDSRTILGEQGAEHLLGHGDMLYMTGGGRIQRVHGPFVSDNDVESVATFLKKQQEPVYVDGITDEVDDIGETLSNNGSNDDLFNNAVELIQRERRVSISFIQRNFQIGYNKAAKLVEQMEKQGIVSPPDRAGKREIIV
jgi:S-DNA-T family DNA segregation ATPase FtsK/SpoIIIE